MYDPQAEKRFFQQPVRRLPALLTLGLLAASGLLAAGKLSPDLAGLPPATNLDVIVQFVGPPTQADLGRVAQAGGRLKAQFRNIPDIVFTVPVAALNGIAAN